MAHLDYSLYYILIKTSIIMIEYEAALMKGYNERSEADREQLEVHAVSLGANVTYSSYAKDGTSSWNNHILDNNRPAYKAWRSYTNAVGEWIQVHQETPRLWTAVIMQGGGTNANWVK
jgi:hypothetical protein